MSEAEKSLRVLAEDYKRLEAENERLQEEVDTWRDLAWRASSDADRLRTVVEAAQELHRACFPSEWEGYGPFNEAMAALHTAVEALDISEPIGGTGPVPDELRAELGWPNLPPHHVAAGEGIEGYLRRTTPRSDDV